MRFTFNPLMASSVNFAVDGQWYTMHPQINIDLGKGNNAEKISQAKALNYKFRKKRGASILEIIDPARPTLLPQD